MTRENTVFVVVKSIVLHKGKCLIVKRKQEDDIGGGAWECAGGGIEFGEQLDTALLREIQEESGLSVEIDRLLYATTFKTSSHRQVVILMYLSHSFSDNVVLSDEHSDYLWATIDEVKQNIDPGILKDFEKYNVFSLPFFIDDQKN